MKLCVGNTFLEIGKSELVDYELIVPPTFEEQATIAQTLTDINTEITTAESRLTKARQIKQA